MPCLLLSPPCLRPCLVASLSRPPDCRFRARKRQRFLRLGVRMGEMSMVGNGTSPEAGAPGEGDAMMGGEGLPGARREVARWASWEATLNRMSKWLVAGSFAFAALWKHDAETMWALMGSVVNSVLSQVLKKVLNHERPAPALRSDPGMPSSHAQSIFYAATILDLSLFYWLGTSYLTMIIGPATLLTATYLSWLRVSQRLHTPNQIIVGAAVGSVFGAVWFVLWHSLVQEAFASSVLVQIAVILGTVAFCVCFVVHMIRHWYSSSNGRLIDWH